MTDRLPTAADVEKAAAGLPRTLVRETSLIEHAALSAKFDARILLKDETEQPVRSYKIRGASWAVANAPTDREIVCASAGNHAQGIAASCNHLERRGRIFMPRTTPLQKQDATRRFGNGKVEIELVGDVFDTANDAAQKYAESHDGYFIHPFDHPDVIAGQGTVAHEIFAVRNDVDVIIGPVGGGGLISGIGIYTKHRSPHTRVIGVEPHEAAAMHASLEAKEVVKLDSISTFIDGAAVRRPGDLTFALVQQHVDSIARVPENRVCSTFMELQEEYGIHVELAGALSVDVLQDLRSDIRGKTVVCILSGNNFDLRRSSAVVERSDRHRGLKMYFEIALPERSQALKELLDQFGPEVNISYLHFDEMGDAAGRNGQEARLLIGVTARAKGTLDTLQNTLDEEGYAFKNVSDNRVLHDMIGH